MNTREPLPSYRLRLLSCLLGSERHRRALHAPPELLSCLLGSELVSKDEQRRHNLLSCLLGSELRAPVTAQ